MIIFTLIHIHIIWNKIVSLKLSLFMRKTINKKIPTKDNLILQGVTPSDSLCVRGCSQEESINHLFMDC